MRTDCPFTPKNPMERRALHIAINNFWTLTTKAQLRDLLKRGKLKPGYFFGYGPKMHSILMEKAGLILPP
jgi:hypothetical protein